MNINCLQRATAYATIPNADQKTFKTTLTREAQDKLTAENSDTQTTAQPLENQTGLNTTQSHETSRLVNIIA